MGTRSITTIRSNWDGGSYRTHTHIYRHWDGYPEGHGVDLYEFLKATPIVNGLTMDMKRSEVANGPGRLAAKLVAHLPENEHDPDIIGGAGDDCPNVGQEYQYIIDINFGMSGGKIQRVRIMQGYDVCDTELFSGDLEEFGKFVNS